MPTMNSPVPDEIRNDIWHLLLHVYTYQDKSRRILDVSPTRFELGSEIIALNALAESIALRVARLADRTKGVRSIKHFAKKVSAPTDEFNKLVKEFEEQAEPVLIQRHAKIAHMKVGDLSSYPVEPLTPGVFQCVETLVNLFDEYSGRPVEYSFKVDSQEVAVNLRESIIDGKRITVLKVAGRG